MPYKYRVPLAYLGVGAIWVAGIAAAWVISGKVGKGIGFVCLKGSEKLLSYAKI